MNEFKVGDKVKVLSINHDVNSLLDRDYQIPFTGEIIGVSNRNYVVQRDGDSWIIRPDELELVSPSWVQRIEKLECNFEQMTSTISGLELRIDKLERKADNIEIKPTINDSANSYTRGQEVEVTDDYVHWLKAMYIYNDGETFKPHNVFLIEANDIVYYNEDEIRPITMQQKTEPTFTLGQRVLVKVGQDEKAGMYLYDDGDKVKQHWVWVIENHNTHFFDADDIRLEGSGE